MIKEVSIREFTCLRYRWTDRVEFGRLDGTDGEVVFGIDQCVQGRVMELAEPSDTGQGRC